MGLFNFLKWPVESDWFELQILNQVIPTDDNMAKCFIFLFLVIKAITVFDVVWKN